MTFKLTAVILSKKDCNEYKFKNLLLLSFDPQLYVRFIEIIYVSHLLLV